MRAFTMASMAVACLVGTGCGSIHLHNEKSAATAKAAAEDFEASKFGEQLKSQRAILLSLEERDVEAFRKLTLVERDQTLLQLAANKEPATTNAGFAYRMLTVLDARLKVLDGDPVARANDQAKAQEALQKLLVAKRKQANARQFLVFNDTRFGSIPACDEKIAALEKPTADSLAAVVSEDFRVAAKERFAKVNVWVVQLGEECRKELGLAAEVRGAEADPGGALAGAISAYQDQKQSTDGNNAKAKIARANLTSAAKSLAKATKDSTAAQAMTDITCPAPQDEGPAAQAPESVAEVPPPPAAGAAEQNDAAASPSQLCSALAELHKRGSVGKKIIAEEKIEKIGFVLQALSGITPLPREGEEVDSSLALIAATTRLGHALRVYRQADEWPPLAPLIIEKQLAEAQLAAANALVALDNRRLAYRAEIVDALRGEINLLGKARTELFGVFGGGDVILAEAPCTRKNARLCSSYEALLRDTRYEHGVPAERPAYRAMAQLSQAYSTARDRQQTAEVRLLLSGYQESLILSEQALASWSAVLVTPIDLLRQYHAGGIKPSDIAPLLQTFGIFTIAGRID